MTAESHDTADTARRDDDHRDQTKTEDKESLKERQEELLDEGVEETFPASDPVSVKRIT